MKRINIQINSVSMKETDCHDNCNDKDIKELIDEYSKERQGLA